jgi:class 3 adenylate cyclase
MREVTRCLLAADLAGFARASADRPPLEIAAFLDDWYRRCAPIITSRGGRIVKFMGDAVLAVFPEDAARPAVECAQALRDEPLQWPVELGANVHAATIAEGEIGPESRYDIFGSGVNQVFMMGGGAGIRVSERIHGQLTDELRARCTMVAEVRR